MDLLQTSVYALPMLLLWGGYWYLRSRTQRHNLDVFDSERRAGLSEPPSLHPVIDPADCIGCQACVIACPEGDILGLIDGKARLLRPTNCIGHGACKEACPTNAIELVFGTETRGIDIPFVRENFETNVPGVFIAGELGGMGLIRNAITQGQLASRAIAQTLDPNIRHDGGLDLVIVGAGPSGISASLAAMECGLNFVTIEQDSLGGTVAHYPRNKIVVTSPVDLPLIGKVRLRETSKESLLRLWQEVIEQVGLEIRCQETALSITPVEDGFRVQTTKTEYRTQTVLLAIGRRGTPRKLGLPGEELAKVAYRLREPEIYRDKRVLVVGGGDAAIEAALRLTEVAGTEIMLSYRGAVFSRASPANRERIEAAVREDQVRVIFESKVTDISPATVSIERGGQTATYPNDAVIICAGGTLPTALLETIGVRVDTKYGAA